MSTGHENVVWQSGDGSWSRGFYEADRYFTDDSDEPEVEYNMGTFSWVSTGHSTKEQAERSWRGANPGGWTEVPMPTTPTERMYWGDENQHLDDLAAKLWADPTARHGCHGTPKRRVPRYLARDIAQATSDAAHYRLGGYSNLPADVSAETAELRRRLPELTAAERAAVSEELAKGADRIEQGLEQGEPRWRHDPRRSDIVREVEALQGSLRALNTEAAANASVPTSGSSRAKTTAKSTPGSFAPRAHSAPDVALGSEPRTR